MKQTEIEQITQRIEDALATGEGGQSVAALIRARAELESELTSRNARPLDLQTVMSVAENGVRRLANDARAEGLTLDYQAVLTYIRETLEAIQNGEQPVAANPPAARRGRSRKRKTTGEE